MVRAIFADREAKRAEARERRRASRQHRLVHLGFLAFGEKQEVSIMPSAGKAEAGNASKSAELAELTAKSSRLGNGSANSPTTGIRHGGSRSFGSLCHPSPSPTKVPVTPHA